MPMVTAAGVALRQGGNVFPFVLLLTAALALFWLRTPLESLLGVSAIRAETKEERSSVTSWWLPRDCCRAGVEHAVVGWQNPLLWAHRNCGCDRFRRASAAQKDGTPHPDAL